MLQLVVQKCMPVLLYDLEVGLCALPTRTLLSLNFTMNRVVMKLFETSNIEIIEECRHLSMSNCQPCNFGNVF